MRGFDPRIHQKKKFKPMDCTVKPGNDERMAGKKRFARNDLRLSPITLRGAASNRRAAKR
jgi:hypothetical protein